MRASKKSFAAAVDEAARNAMRAHKRAIRKSVHGRGCGSDGMMWESYG